VRVPLQHLASVTDWRIFRLRVSPAVLIPRPETELIIDYVVGAIAEHPCGTALERGTWVDLGTGSGAIAIGLAAALPKATIIAVDISAAALEIAQQNAVDNGLSNRIQFLHGSWFEPLIPYLGKLAGVVSNPPYIPHNLIPTLQLEVAHHEPHLALDGGPDGLAYIRHLIDTAPAYLMPGGLWIVEHMAGQADSILSLLSTHGQYTHLQQLPDLNQPERFILARYQETETDISRMTDTPNHTP
jgi:release factor glutamine methyltransferase